MKFKLALLLFLLSTHIVVADEIKSTSEVKPQVTVVEYPKLRVGDIAPSWSLEDIDKRIFKSNDFLGQSSYFLLLQGDYPVGTESQTKSLGPASDIEVGNALRKLETQNQKVFLTGSRRWGQIPFLRDRDLHLRKMYLQNPYQGIWIASIDKTGFVRTIEQSDDHSFLTRILQIGDPTPRLEVGKPAPDFSIPDMNGVVRRVSNLRGRKNLLLTFFPKCFTGGCVNHLTSIQSEYSNYIASDTEVWAVSIDPAQGEKGQIAFAEKWKLQFPLLPDEGRNVSILYGAAQNPNQLASRMSVLIDKDGIVRLIDKQVDIHTHGSDMILQMRRLGMIETPKN